LRPAGPNVRPATRPTAPGAVPQRAPGPRATRPTAPQRPMVPRQPSPGQRAPSPGGTRPAYIGPQVPPGMAQSLGLDISNQKNRFKTPNNPGELKPPPLPPLPKAVTQEGKGTPPLPPKSPPSPAPRPSSTNQEQDEKITPMLPPVLNAEQEEHFKQLQAQAQQHAALQAQREAGIVPTSGSDDGEAPSPQPATVVSSPIPQMMNPAQAQAIAMAQAMAAHQAQAQAQAAAAGGIPMSMGGSLAGLHGLPGLPHGLAGLSAQPHLPQGLVFMSQPSSVQMAGIPVQAGSPLIASGAHMQGVQGIPGMSGMSAGMAAGLPGLTGPSGLHGLMHHPGLHHAGALQLPSPAGLQLPGGMPGLPMHLPGMQMVPGNALAAQLAAAQQAQQHPGLSLLQSHPGMPHGPVILGSPLMFPGRFARPPL